MPRTRNRSTKDFVSKDKEKEDGISRALGSGNKDLRNESSSQRTPSYPFWNISINSYIKKSFIFNFVWSLTFSSDVCFLITRATVIFLSFTTELYHCVCLTRVKPLKLPDLRVSRYRASKTPVQSGFLIISKVYKRSLSTDRNEVLWHTDTLRMNWVDVSTKRYKRQNASHPYWHPWHLWHRILPRDRRYPWEPPPFSGSFRRAQPPPAFSGSFSLSGSLGTRAHAHRVSIGLGPRVRG